MFPKWPSTIPLSSANKSIFHELMPLGMRPRATHSDWSRRGHLIQLGQSESFSETFPTAGGEKTL